MQKREARKFIFIFALGVASLAILGYALGLFSLPANKPMKVECLGGDALSAPVFSLPDLQGKKVDLISFRGKVILLEFWATWCGPCKVEIPYLNELHNRFNKNGLVVIGISLDRREPEMVQKFLEKMGVDYINLMGDEEVFENYSRLAGLGSIRGIPATFLIDRQGRICKSFVGLTEKEVLEKAIQPIL